MVLFPLCGWDHFSRCPVPSPTALRVCCSPGWRRVSVSEEFALLRSQSLGAAWWACKAEGQGAGGAAVVVSVLLERESAWKSIFANSDLWQRIMAVRLKSVKNKIYIPQCHILRASDAHWKCVCLTVARDLCYQWWSWIAFSVGGGSFFFHDCVKQTKYLCVFHGIYFFNCQ